MKVDSANTMCNYIHMPNLADSAKSMYSSHVNDGR